MNKAFVFIFSVLFFQESAWACNWYRVGDFGETLECRTAWNHYLWGDSERTQQLFDAAKFYAEGQIEKISNESWAVRQLLNNEQGNKLLENRINATDILNEMNTQLRRRASMDEAINTEDWNDLIPSAFMVGWTLPFNPKVSLTKLSEKAVANLGGSAFLGVVVLPQRVQWIMDNKGKLIEANHLTFEMRSVIIPSGDLMIGTDGKFKSTKRQFTIGFVFGENIWGSHQLLGNGWSISFPTQFTKLFATEEAVASRALARTGFWSNVKAKTQSFFSNPGQLATILPAFLSSTASPYFDTIKVGISTSHQNPNEKVDKAHDLFRPYQRQYCQWLCWRRFDSRYQLSQIALR